MFDLGSCALRRLYSWIWGHSVILGVKLSNLNFHSIISLHYRARVRVLRFRYSKGFGVVRYLLGEEHLLNAPNCVIGIGFYALQLILGRPIGQSN